MFLARIDGVVTSVQKHPALEGCRFLIAQRLEADGRTSGEPLVLLDWLGASLHTTVIASLDGDIARKKLSNNAPARMVVVGIVDSVSGGRR